MERLFQITTAKQRSHCRTAEQIQNNPSTGEGHLHSYDYNKTIALSADSCHAHFFDEATTEDEENCKLILQNKQLSLVAAKSIEPGGQLLTRYGHQYWCKPK
jgi:hypothetical protein